eukprot:6434720-Lingulodinium_polyedra.AAC.1
MDANRIKLRVRALALIASAVQTDTNKHDTLNCHTPSWALSLHGQNQKETWPNWHSQEEPRKPYSSCPSGDRPERAHCSR